MEKRESMPNSKSRDKQVTPYEFADMTSHIRHENLKKSYQIGSELDILKDAFDADWIVADREGGYDGYWYAVFVKDGKWHILAGYSEVDGYYEYEDNPEKWLKEEVKNVRVFKSKEDIVKWIEKADDYDWSYLKGLVLDKLQ